MESQKDTLQSRGAQIRMVVERVRQKMKEQEALLSELERHAGLLELGVDPEQIGSFKAPHMERHPKAIVTMKTGEVVVVPLRLVSPVR